MKYTKKAVWPIFAMILLILASCHKPEDDLVNPNDPNNPTITEDNLIIEPDGEVLDLNAPVTATLEVNNPFNAPSPTGSISPQFKPNAWADWIDTQGEFLVGGNPENEEFLIREFRKSHPEVFDADIPVVTSRSDFEYKHFAVETTAEEGLAIITDQTGFGYDSVTVNVSTWIKNYGSEFTYKLSILNDSLSFPTLSMEYYVEGLEILWVRKIDALSGDAIETTGYYYPLPSAGNLGFPQRPHAIYLQVNSPKATAWQLGVSPEDVQGLAIEEFTGGNISTNSVIDVSGESCVRFNQEEVLEVSIRPSGPNYATSGAMKWKLQTGGGVQTVYLRSEQTAVFQYAVPTYLLIGSGPAYYLGTSWTHESNGAPAVTEAVLSIGTDFTYYPDYLYELYECLGD